MLKKIIINFFLISILNLAFSDNFISVMYDHISHNFKDFGFKGKVKKVIKKIYNKSIENDLSYKEEYIFNEMGNLKELITYTRDGVICEKKIYYYDNSNYLVKIEDVKKNTRYCSYDDKKNIKSISIQNYGDDKKVLEHEYFYDNSSKLIKVNYIIQNNIAEVYYEFKYNDGKLIEESWFIPHSNYLQKYEYLYNNNLLIKKIETLNSFQVRNSIMIIEYFYNENNMLTNEKTYFNNKFWFNTTYKYDKDNNLLSIYEENIDNSAPSTEEIYVYDSIGNIIKFIRDNYWKNRDNTLIKESDYYYECEFYYYE